MEKKPEPESDWIAIGDNFGIPEKMGAGTDEFRFRILAAMLANELKDLEGRPFI